MRSGSVSLTLLVGLLLIFFISNAASLGKANRKPKPPKCGGLQLKGKWTLMWKGVSANGKMTNGIGAVQIAKGGIITSGWVMRKADQTFIHTSVTGNFTMGEHCSSILSVRMEDSFEFAFQGVVSSNNQFMLAFSKVEGAQVLGEVHRVIGKDSCTKPNNIRGVWSTSSQNLFNDYSQTYSETLDCRNKKKLVCDIYYVGNPIPPEYTDVTVNATFVPSRPCGYFTFGWPFEGHRMVSSGDGLHSLMDKPAYHLSSRYYRGRV